MANEHLVGAQRHWSLGKCKFKSQEILPWTHENGYEQSDNNNKCRQDVEKLGSSQIILGAEKWCSSFGK